MTKLDNIGLSFVFLGIIVLIILMRSSQWVAIKKIITG